MELRKCHGRLTVMTWLGTIASLPIGEGVGLSHGQPREPWFGPSSVVLPLNADTNHRNPRVNQVIVIYWRWKLWFRGGTSTIWGLHSVGYLSSIYIVKAGEVLVDAISHRQAGEREEDPSFCRLPDSYIHTVLLPNSKNPRALQACRA